jgi:transposase-like protein
MFLNQGLQNGTSHEQGVAAGVYTIVRDATPSTTLQTCIVHLIRIIGI